MVLFTMEYLVLQPFERNLLFNIVENIVLNTQQWRAVLYENEFTWVKEVQESPSSAFQKGFTSNYFNLSHYVQGGTLDLKSRCKLWKQQFVVNKYWSFGLSSW